MSVSSRTAAQPGVGLRRLLSRSDGGEGLTRELVYTGFMTVDGVVDSPGGGEPVRRFELLPARRYARPEL